MKDGDSFIVTYSVANILGFVNLSAYVIGKHAIVGIMRLTAIEVAARKIRVDSVYPVLVNIRMMRSMEEAASAGHGEELKRQFETASLRRLCRTL